MKLSILLLIAGALSAPIKSDVTLQGSLHDSGITLKSGIGASPEDSSTTNDVSSLLDKLDGLKSNLDGADVQGSLSGLLGKVGSTVDDLLNEVQAALGNVAGSTAQVKRDTATSDVSSLLDKLDDLKSNLGGADVQGLLSGLLGKVGSTVDDLLNEVQAALGNAAGSVTQ
ncbi:DEHA2G25124p [Debaryomyces hansenii CBS767]|uniref:DEHA2G25124p n=1 Tax=Debaryomyces hansenii (strain ATCC 36239 / CBS 767 / BCRC 21394 / JCM 1990 / NBRC 0083 / IGC 2968) TaxID=284592 RepID=Q6BGN0_DEBHA|nr:DEHA2G25124p [Debaryomyces hansenii CBS767]CAG91160.2 DEHA2G25124p [Debaryomyces hansenii CBS767]|eukprot:XP_462641.2 DEHA2G25124p [Debaryomyces hansenii CBS767]